MSGRNDELRREFSSEGCADAMCAAAHADEWRTAEWQPGPELVTAALANAEERARVAEAERDEARAELQALADPHLTDMRLENGGLNMEMAGTAVQRIVATIGEWFIESGATNYVEFNLHRSDPVEHFAITIQKVGQGAKSPHELRAAAEAQVEALARRVAKLEANTPDARARRALGDPSKGVSLPAALLPTPEAPRG